MEHKQHIERFKNIKSDRSTWNHQFQLLGEYISQVKQNFEASQTPGEFLNEDIFDSLGTFAAHNSASALLGLLWPGSAKQSIEIVPPKDLEDDGEVKEFYENMHDRTVSAMDNPTANLSLALDEYMLDQMIFGTSGVGVDEGETSKLLFKPYGVKEMYIEEGRGGKVIEIYLLFEWRLGRVVDEYGIDEVSEGLRKKYNDGKRDEKVKILHVITPRDKPKAEEGALAMPIASIHIEYDGNHTIKESGFNEMPIAVGRFRKLNYERYGRSPGMMALPDIREANALREAVIVATEKILNMPKGVFNDSTFGGGVIDTSPNSITVFNSEGQGGQTPIFDIGAPPDVNVALVRLEALRDSIAQHFNIDRLLDFNNDQEMTFGEAQIRNNIRISSLASLFARQITEVFTPIIERSVNILFRKGEFGVIPGSEEEQELLDQGVQDIEYIPDVLIERLERGESIYEVRYKTQAAAASRAEDYRAIIETIGFVGQISQIDPSAIKRIDYHEAIKEMASIRSLPAGIVKADEVVEAEAEAEAKARQAQQEMEMLQQGAAVAKDVAPLMQNGNNQ